MESSSSPQKLHTYAVEWATEQGLTNCSSVFRNPQSPETLITNFPHPISSIYDGFERACAAQPLKDCIGIQALGGDGKPFYQWTSYTEWKDLVVKSAKVLEKYCIGTGGNKFVVMAATISKEWLLLDMALLRICAISVPFYQSLGPEAVAQIFEETEAETLAGPSQDLIKYIKEVDLKSVKNLVCLDTPSEELLSFSHKYKIIELAKEIQEQSLIDTPIHSTPPDLETVLTLSYTSGTTGTAKGALLRHKNLIAALASLKFHYGEIDYSVRNVVLLFLPLAHIMGRVGLYSAYINRVSQGLFGGDLTKLLDDVRLLKPTGFTGVPRILNKIYDGIHHKMQMEGQEKYSLFQKALQEKISALRKDGSVTHVHYDSHIFNKLKPVLGGQVRRIVTGSAPISRDVLQFFRVVFCCEVIEGYGQTESSAASFLTPPIQTTTGHVGSVQASIQFKLEDVPELNYLHTDKPYP